MLQSLQGRATCLAQHGFINYFGEQRFGPCEEEPIGKVGIFLLKRDYRRAVEAILGPQASDSAVLAEAKAAYVHEGPAAMLRLLPKSSVAERFLLQGLLKGLRKREMGNQLDQPDRPDHPDHPDQAPYQQAIMALPFATRVLHVRALQSLLFNQLASKRAQAFGSAVLPGDLVRVVEGTEHDHNSGNTDAATMSTRRLTAVEAAHTSLFDVVLPLTWRGHTPDNPCVDLYANLLQPLGLTAAEMNDPPKFLGVGTHVFRPFASQVHGLQVEQLAEPGAYALDFRLRTGTYATVLLRELLH